MATLSASAPAVATGDRAGHAIRDGILSAATATTLLAIALLVTMTPWSMHFLLDTAAPPGQPFAVPEQTHGASDRTVHDLVLGGEFALTLGAEPFYTAAEIAHLENVRVVLYAFLGLAAASALLVGLALARAHDRSAAWRAVGRGGIALAFGVLALGLVGLIAFGPAFELFHRIFFFGGNWAFDPESSRLIQLYPQGFWIGATTMLGGVALALGLLTRSIAHIRVAADR